MEPRLLDNSLCDTQHIMLQTLYFQSGLAGDGRTEALINNNNNK